MIHIKIIDQGEVNNNKKLIKLINKMYHETLKKV